MNAETKKCQNCMKDFKIEPDDFGFYEKIKVPPPTWCPECRMIRRMNFRNERSLYKQDCDLCKKPTISMYASENKYIVYCNDCFSSDKWDAMNYGKDYDFSKNFFEQLGELFKKIPRRALFQDFAVNSDYTNQSVYMKNCYLCFGGHHYEDSSYCAQNFFLKNCYFVFGGHHYEDSAYCAQNLFLKNCIDVDFSYKSELCFESVHLINCFKVRYGYYSENCIDS